MDDLISYLEQASNGLFEWLKNNVLKSNPQIGINGRVILNVDGFEIGKRDTE